MKTHAIHVKINHYIICEKLWIMCKCNSTCEKCKEWHVTLLFICEGQSDFNWDANADDNILENHNQLLLKLLAATGTCSLTSVTCLFLRNPTKCIMWKYNIVQISQRNLTEWFFCRPLLVLESKYLYLLRFDTEHFSKLYNSLRIMQQDIVNYFGSLSACFWQKDA